MWHKISIVIIFTFFYFYLFFIFRLFTYFFRGLLFPLPSPPMYRHDSCLGMEGKKIHSASTANTREKRHKTSC